MAGVKGKSGGSRPNTGGKRAGAGRKPDPNKPKPEEPKLAPDSPLLDGRKREPIEFLDAVINDTGVPLKDRIRAAIAAAQYVNTKTRDGGKKEAAADRAEKAKDGKYGPRPAPLKLVGDGGK